ncbi:hypothetical protein B0O99DRAFT_617808 [Bisporella sp. PMI_857]|nr:hypothetical protein B0O99DRAFT_617808 [Bisporella sp. PMI_857]
MPSLYEISIPVFVANLKILSSLLTKGIDHVGEEKASELLNSRLIADMQPLTYQIQRVSDTSKGLATRLSGGKVENVIWADDENSFPALQARIQKTIAFLEAVPQSAFDGQEDAEIVFKTRSGETKFTGSSYVLKFAIPNFFFHFVTAFALLRKEGVPIGKNDYLQPRK